MQLIGIDHQKKRVIAIDAQKGIDYFCPTCEGILRLRRGSQMQAHFYHYKKSAHCQQRKKTLAHLYTQIYLTKILPEGAAIIEHPFPTIGRIADVFWPSHNIVFEIQCSYMTVAEAAKRESDYKSAGMTLIWILHEARYNQKTLSPTEKFFSCHHVYYTSITEKGTGSIYDQFEVVDGNKRCFKGAKFTITPSLPYVLQDRTFPPLPYPKIFQHRLETRTLGFSGDMLDVACNLATYDYSSLMMLEKRYEQSAVSFAHALHLILRRGLSIYRAFLYAILEKILMR